MNLDFHDVVYAGSEGSSETAYKKYHVIIHITYKDENKIENGNIQ